MNISSELKGKSQEKSKKKALKITLKIKWRKNRFRIEKEEFSALFVEFT
jgi:hypothetical protein